MATNLCANSCNKKAGASAISDNNALVKNCDESPLRIPPSNIKASAKVKAAVAHVKCLISVEEKCHIEPVWSLILAAWNGESERAIGLGNWYHNQREENLCEFNTIEREGVEVPIIRPIIDSKGVKIAPTQKLDDGVYPEHFVYLKSLGVCGQADLVTIVNGKIVYKDGSLTGDIGGQKLIFTRGR